MMELEGSCLMLVEEVAVGPRLPLGGEMEQKEPSAAGVDWLARGALQMLPKSRHRGSDRLARL